MALLKGAARRPAVLLMVAALLAPAPAAGGRARVKDIARVQGTTPWPLIGYGLVVGLNRTGDGNKTMFTTQSVASMLRSLGVQVPAADLKLKNVAAVVVTAEISPFARRGARLDVTVSSLGDATSLEGGELLLVPLRSMDGVIRAWGQGAVSVAGYNVSVEGGGGVRQNHTTVGRVPGGGTVERELDPVGEPASGIAVHLERPDFTTASNMARAINRGLARDAAAAMDGGTVLVAAPAGTSTPDDLVRLIAEVEGIEVEVDELARVVINERTGTVVVGAHVRLLPAAIAHGNLSVRIDERPAVSQPGPFSEGETVYVPEFTTQVESGEGHLVPVANSPTVEDLARALNSLGVTPRDLVAIFQALKHAGALPAELVTM